MLAIFMHDTNWETELSNKIRDTGAIYDTGVLIVFIRDLITHEREAAVKEFCQRLNDQGLGEDEDFKRFCEEFTKFVPEAFKEMIKKL